MCLLCCWKDLDEQDSMEFWNLVRFGFRMWEILVLKWFLLLKIQINFKKPRFWKEKSVEDEVVTLGPTAQATLVVLEWIKKGYMPNHYIMYMHCYDRFVQVMMTIFLFITPIASNKILTICFWKLLHILLLFAIVRMLWI